MQSAFPNRSVAGHRLAQKLACLKQVESKSRNERIVIIAIPRGGVVIGDRIASELEAELDIVVSRKIGAPDNPEFAIGAVMPRKLFLKSRTCRYVEYSAGIYTNESEN